MRFILFALLLTSSSWANQDAAYREGEALANSLAKDQKIDVDVAKSMGFDVPKAVLKGNASAGETAEDRQIREEIQTSLMESLNNGDFKISDDEDLIKLSDAVVENPDLALNGSITLEDDMDRPGDLKTCIEPVKAYPVTCRETLIAKDVDYTPEQTLHKSRWVPTAPIFFNPNNSEDKKIMKKWRDNRFNDQSILDPLKTRKYSSTSAFILPGHWRPYTEIIQEKIDLKEPRWSTDCAELQHLKKEGYCREMKRVCIDSENRFYRISDKESREVSPPGGCWTYETSFVCAGLSKTNTCKSLRRAGCSQVDSKPLKTLGGKPVEFEQTLECRRKKIVKENGNGTGVDVCAFGNCTKKEWEPNEDMADALSKIAALAEMAKNAKDLNENIPVFKGDGLACRKAMAGFRSCCGTGKGWGNKIGYHCNENEKKLALSREQGKCQIVGSYCSQKVLGKCIQKKTTYCCFANKLVAQIQIQGRPQLGRGWGNPKNPDCGGLTIHDLTRIDFSKIDLSGVFRDQLQKSMKTLTPARQKEISQEAIKNIQDRMPKPGDPYPMNKFKEGKGEM